MPNVIRCTSLKDEIVLIDAIDLRVLQMGLKTSFNSGKNGILCQVFYIFKEVFLR